jgi:drug/metabolite transporter (DMT)-like permease
MKKIPPHALLLLATILWGGNFVIGRAVATDVPPFTLSFFRWAVAFLVFLPIVWPNVKQDWQKIREHFGIVIILSITGIATFNTLVYIALHYTTSINASLTQSSTPILIYLLSFIFLKEKLTKKQIIGAFLSLIGVLLIISSNSPQFFTSFSLNIGDMLMLIAVLSWSIYSLLIKQYANKLPSNTTFFVTITIGIVILTPFFIYEWNTMQEPINWHLGSISAVFYIGIFASIIAFLSWNSGVVKLGASKAGVFLNFIPVFASIFAVLFIGETVQVSQLTGAAFVISGVYLASKQSKKALQLD